MSVRSDAAVCRTCGLVDLRMKMVVVDEPALVFVCAKCAPPKKAKKATSAKKAKR